MTPRHRLFANPQIGRNARPHGVARARDAMRGSEEPDPDWNPL